MFVSSPKLKEKENTKESTHKRTHLRDGVDKVHAAQKEWWKMRAKFTFVRESSVWKYWIMLTWWTELTEKVYIDQSWCNPKNRKIACPTYTQCLKKHSGSRFECVWKENIKKKKLSSILKSESKDFPNAKFRVGFSWKSIWRLQTATKSRKTCMFAERQCTLWAP